MGYKYDQIREFSRWEMVQLLRQKSSQAVSEGLEGENRKYARGVRFTSKKQREEYQKQVNKIFFQQMRNLANEKPEKIPNDSDIERKEREEHKNYNEKEAISTKNLVEVSGAPENIEKITDIPDYEMLLLSQQAQPPPEPPSQGPKIGQNNPALGMGSNQNQEMKAALDQLQQRLKEGRTTMKCKVIKKTIMTLTEPRQVEKVVFCSEPKQIKNLIKRLEKISAKPPKAGAKTKLNPLRSRFDHPLGFDSVSIDL